MWRGLARLTLLALVAAPRSGPAAPLPDVLARVYQESPRLAAGRSGLRAADELVARARAARRPFLASQSTFGVATTGPLQRQALTLQQSVYGGGELKAEIARAEHAALAERARLAQLEADVLLAAIVAYTGVAREAAVLELARTNEERLRLQLDATRDRERFGDVTRTDVAQAETRSARATSDRIAAEGALDEASSDYARVVGEPPAGLTLPDPPALAAASREEAAAAVEASPRWQEASLEAAAARDAVAAALGALKPRLSLGAEVGVAGEGGWQADGTTGASIGATLAVPLYQGGAEYARVRQSKDLLNQRRFAREDARRQVEAEIAAAWAALRTADAAIAALQREVDAAGFALEGVRQEALVGARLVLDVLDAEQELFTAEADLVRARAGRVRAGYRLQAAVGRLSAKELGLNVKVEDPAAHARAAARRWFGLGERVRED